MKISFENLCKFHKQLTEWYGEDGHEEILLKPLESGFEIVKMKNHRESGQRTWYQQNDYEKSLEEWIEK